MRLFLFVVLAALIGGLATAQPPGVTFKLPSSGAKKTFANVASLKATITPASARPGEVVTFELTIIPEPDCYTYPVQIPPGQVGNNEILIPPPSDLIFVDDQPADPLDGLKTKKSQLDPNVIEKYYPHPATPTWRLKAVVSPKATAGVKKVALVGSVLQACDKSNCYTTPPKSPPVAEFTVASSDPVPVPPQYVEKVNQALMTRGGPPPQALPAGNDPPAPLTKPDEKAVVAKTAPGLVQKAPLATEQYQTAMDGVRAKIEQTPVAVQGGLGGLLLAAAFWGFVSLATPCVFPMIPITVSLFLKQGQQSTTAAVRLAAVYCLTIIVVLGVSAITLLSVFQELSNHPDMNLFLGGVFVFFALGLFGMYEVTIGKVLWLVLVACCWLGYYLLRWAGLPANFNLSLVAFVFAAGAFLLVKSGGVEGKLLQFTEKRRGAGGLLGTVFGALAFSIVSFTCVAPFLGGFAGMTSSGQFSKPELILAGITFAAAFASPFFVLALFPSLLKKLPKSGGWLDSVKVVMGFLELAAALKFLRSAELLLVGQPKYFTYDLVLGSWVAIAVVTGLYLLNFFRLPHDEEKPNIGVMRMLLGVVFLGLAVYLTPALFKGANGQAQRPTGIAYAWVDAFLLPEPSESGDELPWTTDLPGAADRIVREKQKDGQASKPLIFLDITGVNCSNCKLNEKNVFPQSRVRELLQKYTLVQLYADVVPPEVYTTVPSATVRKEEAAINLDFQEKVFGNVQRPLYVILEPQATGKVRVVGVYDEGAINDVPAFVEFLKKPLESK